MIPVVLPLVAEQDRGFWFWKLSQKYFFVILNAVKDL
jgi:hypothetical protein